MDQLKLNEVSTFTFPFENVLNNGVLYKLSLFVDKMASYPCVIKQSYLETTIQNLLQKV